MSAAPSPPRVATIAQVAARCRVTQRTVARWIARHGLAVVRVGAHQRPRILVDADGWPQPSAPPAPDAPRPPSG